MSNQNPACVAALAYRGWAISIECNQPSPDAPASYKWIAFREGLTTQERGFISPGDALNAAMASLDVEIEEEQRYALDDLLAA